MTTQLKLSKVRAFIKTGFIAAAQADGLDIAVLAKSIKIEGDSISFDLKPAKSSKVKTEKVSKSSDADLEKETFLAAIVKTDSEMPKKGFNRIVKFENKKGELIKYRIFALKSKGMKVSARPEDGGSNKLFTVAEVLKSWETKERIKQTATAVNQPKERKPKTTGSKVTGAKALLAFFKNPDKEHLDRLKKKYTKSAKALKKKSGEFEALKGKVTPKAFGTAVKIGKTEAVVVGISVKGSKLQYRVVNRASRMRTVSASDL